MEARSRTELKEIAAALYARSVVGDARTDVALAHMADGIAAVLARVEEPANLSGPDQPRTNGQAHLAMPPEWTRLPEEAGVAFTLDAKSSDDTMRFFAIVQIVPGLGIWRALVALNGSSIMLYEDAERANAMYQAREAIYRAWNLRGPVR